MSIEAMKRALKTFEKIHEGCGFVKEDDLHKDAKDLATYVQEDCDFTMRTLRQAIEQAEQWDTSDMAYRAGGLSVEQAEKQEHEPWCDYLNIMLPSLPPQKAKCNCKQAEKQEKLCKYCGGIGRVVCDGRCMPEQEPVAYRKEAHGMWFYIEKKPSPPNDDYAPLYTAPPKRECEYCSKITKP
jgi:hypothetical protein